MRGPARFVRLLQALSACLLLAASALAAPGPYAVTLQKDVMVRKLAEFGELGDQGGGGTGADTRSRLEQVVFHPPDGRVVQHASDVVAALGEGSRRLVDDRADAGVLHLLDHHFMGVVRRLAPHLRGVPELHLVVDR